jgi:cytochrome c biogenesis protein ResB
MDKRNVPSAVVELRAGGNSLGTWLVSGYINQPQRITHEGRSYELSLRRTRLYKPHSIQLLDFRHDVYPGTDIPKNFSSRVRVMRPDTGEDREVLIYMNNPLRYAGETYYQASFDTDNEGTILQVVRNPGWLAPYFACILVSAGLVIQFMMHMIGFVKKRRAA